MGRIALLLLLLLTTPGCTTYLAHRALASSREETIPDQLSVIVASRVAAEGDAVALQVRVTALSGRLYDYLLDDRGVEGPCGAAPGDLLDGVAALHLTTIAGTVEAGALVGHRDAPLSQEEARTAPLIAVDAIPPGLELLLAPPGGRAPSGRGFSTADDVRRRYGLLGAPPGNHRRTARGASAAGMALFCLVAPLTAAVDLATGPIQLAVSFLFRRWSGP